MAVSAFPSFAPGPAARPERVLMLCYYDPAGISTVPETVAFMQAHSRFGIAVLNLFEHGRNPGGLSLSPRLDLGRFDALVLHNSLAYSVDNLRTLDRHLACPLRDFPGAKVLMKQDENYRFRELAQYIGETGFDLIFTCLPPQAFPLVYPPALVGDPVFVRMLTGYVTPTLRSLAYPAGPRPIDIGYRGSIQPLSFGRLAYEKRKIGEDLARLAAGRGLNLDISSRWEDRLGAEAWFDFLGRCKATLGTESGASVFDLDGDLAERCAGVEARFGPPREDADYAEAYLAALADLEGRVAYEQISPRHFEAAATGTLQVMYPGEYSGIFVAGRHYVALARDYGNLDEVLALVRDDRRRLEIVERARREIVDNPRYWIETFVRGFDRHLAGALKRRGRYATPLARVGRGRANVLLLCTHKPSLDPRLDWTARWAPADLCITQVGVLATDQGRSWIEDDAAGTLVLAAVRTPFHPDVLGDWAALAGDAPAAVAALAELNRMALLLGLDDAGLAGSLGAPLGDPRIATFRWYLGFFLDSTATLMAQVQAMRGFRALIATDLPALPAALLVKGVCAVPVLYDAHECWPEADVEGLEFERAYWAGSEARLVAHLDRCQTVSPGLAVLMAREYGRDYAAVPNCEPLVPSPPDASASRDAGTCRFLYQGNFAPKRGLEPLIQAWPATDPRAVLLLRGPDNAYKQTLVELARGLGILDLRVFFPAPVGETDLVAAAREADVGVLPYARAGANYSNCSPNKLSQYMAAGLPLLANDTNFVAQVVHASGAGVVVDFGRAEGLVAAVARLVADPDWRADLGSRAAAYHREVFHWERVAAPMYQALQDLVAGRPGTLRIYPLSAPRPLYGIEPPAPQPVAEPPPPPPPPPSLRYCAWRLVRGGLGSVWRIVPAGLRRRVGPRLHRLLDRSRHT